MVEWFYSIAVTLQNKIHDRKKAGMPQSNEQVTVDAVMAALRTVDDPGLHKDLVTLNMIRDVKIESGTVSFTLVLTTMACPMKSKMQDEARTAVLGIAGVNEVNINLTAETAKSSRASVGQKTGQITLQDLLPTVKNAIAVASGKGGVGKSTVSTNTAIALAKEGARVGLMDADVYGPSVPTMMGINQAPDVTPDEKIIPIRQYGIDMISIGFLIPEDQSVIWRGPMVAKLIQQFLEGVEWGELDYLIIDLPPGTGDTQLTLTQNVPLAGGLIVSTPQAVALADVRRAAAMFEKVDVPILGVVENMSTFICPKCGHEEHIFAHGGAAEEAKRLNVPYLGDIPIDVSIRKGGDAGVPVVESAPDSPVGQAFIRLARDMAGRISLANLSERRDERSDSRELPTL